MCASVAKNESRNRPPIKIGSVFAVAVITVATQTPTAPMKIRTLRPRQSAIQMKNEATICPTYPEVSCWLADPIDLVQVEEEYRTNLVDCEDDTCARCTFLWQIVVGSVVG